jgi:uncharacterized membrane protein
VTSVERAVRARRLAIGVWLLLAASIAAWPINATGIGLTTTAIALLPLIPPLPGLVRGRRRILQWSPLTLAPALAIALTEILVNAAARVFVTLTLALILAAFATVVAALRVSPRVQ